MKQTSLQRFFSAQLPWEPGCPSPHGNKFSFPHGLWTRLILNFFLECNHRLKLGLWLHKISICTVASVILIFYHAYREHVIMHFLNLCRYSREAVATWELWIPAEFRKHRGLPRWLQDRNIEARGTHSNFLSFGHRPRHFLFENNAFYLNTIQKMAGRKLLHVGRWHAEMPRRWGDECGTIVSKAPFIIILSLEKAHD